ncbi:MAG: hypothetical protein DDT23_01056 [candidate division WS2 bacterium]|nr:hypothetical protein [Candidatus Lithacetigena glycinireducens]
MKSNKKYEVKVFRKRNCGRASTHQITQRIRCRLTPLPFGTLLPSVATSYMLIPIDEMPRYKQKGHGGKGNIR